jgi:hypothetical protein
VLVAQVMIDVDHRPHRQVLLDPGAVRARALQHDDGVEHVREAGRRLLAHVNPLAAGQRPVHGGCWIVIPDHSPLAHAAEEARETERRADGIAVGVDVAGQQEPVALPNLLQ